MNPEARIQNPEFNGFSQFERDGFQIIKSLAERGGWRVLHIEYATPELSNGLKWLAC